nr:acyltransferase family protein [Novosphingobium sp. CECT 9465]
MIRHLYSGFAFARSGQDQRAQAGYRSDIDGMRAIAVIAVVLFHLDFRMVGGGFVGVDIFFVISGYLIGKSILQQLREGRFSLGDFYQRRLRRIAPALVAMLAATTVAGWFILLPSPYAGYGASLIAAVLSVANIYFWFETDYFAAAAHEQPLLHTWSLGVEEQFYILLPIALLATFKARRLDLAWLAFLAFASFAASIVIARSSPTANFYLIPTRAWELLLGTFSAELGFRILRERRILREILAVMAIAVIALCIFTYDRSTSFPGLGAAPPVVATAVLLSIGAHGSSVVSRALGLKPAVWAGLISYSLYLWHWPVIVLMKQWMASGWLRMPDRIMALAIMVILAVLSWWLVERPFRSARVSNRAVWWFSGISALLLSLAGAGLVLANGVAQRFRPDIAQVAGWLDRPEGKRDGCIIGLFASPGTAVSPSCLQRDGTRPDVLILGDSHANHLRKGLARRYPGINFMQAAAAGCRVTIEPAPNETPTCSAFRKEVFGHLLSENPPRHVLLALFWGEGISPSLKPTVDWMQQRGIDVIIGGPVARYEVALPQAIAVSKMRGDLTITDRTRIPGVAEADAAFRTFAESEGVGYMSSYSAMCPNDKCIVEIKPGLPIQFDSHHLNDEGSYIVSAAFPADRVLAAGKASGAADRAR